MSDSLNALVYDIEIVKAIRGQDEAPIEGIEYCGGWTDHAGMGISVVGVHDLLTGRDRVFCSDNLSDFFELLKCRRVWITFNGIGFDNKVLSTVGEFPTTIHEHYDILREVWLCRGLNPDKFYWKTHGGFGLDDICRANGLGGKTGHGALAPVQWQRGEIGSVIDYCLQDVKLTSDLFKLCQAGPIKSPKGGTMELRRVS
jgi:hypothetical protein